MRGRSAWIVASGVVCFASSVRAEEPAPGGEGALAQPAGKAAPAQPTGERPLLQYQVEGQRAFAVSGAQRSPLDLREPVLSVHLLGAELYVAHGDAGVAVYDVSEPAAPKLLREIPTPGASATGFAVIEGQLWVLTVSRSASPLGPSLPKGSVAAPPAADAESTRVRPEERESTLVERERAIALRVVNPGTVELAVGRRDGVRVGDRFAVYRTEGIDGGGSGFAAEELVALAEVVALKEASALADLNRGAVVRDADTARRAREEQKESNAYPVRVPHVAEVGGVLRPIINAGSPLGVGVLADASGSYWGKAYFVDVVLQPVGLGWTEDGNVVSAAALLQAGYDGRAFAVGLGAGMSWVNGNADYMLEQSGFGSADVAETGGPTETVERQDTRSAFTLSQLARLGARDGLSLSLRNLLILHEDSEADTQGFIYGGTLGKLTVPLDRRSDLFLEAGGGIMGYWLVGAGVGTWLVGNGSPGSWKLSISAGAGGIWGSREVTETRQLPNGQASTYTYDDEVEISGPMVSAGVLRRFAW